MLRPPERYKDCVKIFRNVLIGFTQPLDKLEFGDLYCATTKLSLRTSDRCHWCGNPFSFLTVSASCCVKRCGLPRQCAHWLAMTYWTTQARKNRACPKDGKITTRAKARIARGGIPTNSNSSLYCLTPICTLFFAVFHSISIPRHGQRLGLYGFIMEK